MLHRHVGHRGELTVLQSYCCGAINVLGWISITAAVSIILPQLILAMVVFNDPGYTPERWHYFVLYEAINLAVLMYNVFALKRTPWVHNVGCEFCPSFSCQVVAQGQADEKKYRPRRQIGEAQHHAV